MNEIYRYVVGLLKSNLSLLFSAQGTWHQQGILFLLSGQRQSDVPGRIGSGFLTSPSCWFGFSSMQITGRKGSYASLWKFYKNLECNQIFKCCIENVVLKMKP